MPIISEYGYGWELYVWNEFQGSMPNDHGQRGWLALSSLLYVTEERRPIRHRAQ